MEPHIMSHAIARAPVSAPEGAEPWVAMFLHAAHEETVLLQRNGALGEASARNRVLEQFLDALREWLESELTTAEAEQEVGRKQEMLRRAVRHGNIPDRRPNGQGRHRFRRADLALLAKGKRKKYDPVADAQDIAQLRRAG